MTDKPMSDKWIGARLRSLRRERNMSQGDLARAVRFKSSTAVFYLETGKRHLRVIDLLKICTIFHISVSEFFGDCVSGGSTTSNKKYSWRQADE